MVTKKRSGRKAAPRRRVYAARRAAPRRRKSTGYDKIAPAMATVALVAVNAGKLKRAFAAVTNNGKASIGQYPKNFIDGVTGASPFVQSQMKPLVEADALVTDAVAIAGGYVGGEIVRKYAPTVIKKPLAKLAKKIPKVI